MRITVTFCDQTEHKRRGDEQCYSCFSRSEAEPLPHFIEFETSPVFDHEYFCGAFGSNGVLARRSLALGQLLSLAIFAFGAAEPKPNGNVALHWSHKSPLLIAMT
jgi:hypothetical protein